MKNLLTKLSLVLLLGLFAAPVLTGCESSKLVSVVKTANPSNMVYTGPIEINGATVMADFEDSAQQLPGLYSQGEDKISQTFIVFEKGLKFSILDDYSLLTDLNTVNATTLGDEEIKQSKSGKNVILPYKLYYKDGKPKLNSKTIQLSF